MSNAQRESRVFSTVAIDMFAVITLVLVLQQQVSKKEPEIQHKVDGSQTNFVPAVYLLGNRADSRVFDRRSNEWIPFPSTWDSTNKYFVECEDYVSCYQSVPNIKPVPEIAKSGVFTWTLPIEHQTHVYKTFSELCSKEGVCNVTFLHSKQGVEVLAKRG